MWLVAGYGIGCWMVRYTGWIYGLDMGLVVGWMVGYTGWLYGLDIGKGVGWLDIRAVGTWPAEALMNQTHWRPPR